MTAYYNEIDPKNAAWLRELIKQGHIADGVVDERSIEDVLPEDLAAFSQCHFFAGIGVWSYALKLAGWPDDKPVWTGSCPCQPFSAAGERTGFADERHLWPAFHHLIEQRRPVTVFGEQVAGKDGLAWIDLVLADLEGTGYSAGAVDTCAAGFGAPNIRQRLYWVADSQRERFQGGVSGRTDTQRENINGHAGCGGTVGGMENPERKRLGGWSDGDKAGHDRPIQITGRSSFGGADSTNGFWRNADWLGCKDGKFRPVEPGTFPLADGAPAKLGRLRGYGNAINAEAAKGFIESYMSEFLNV
jgi:DNA (cytosine-5)-methyltransferase 1